MIVEILIQKNHYKHNHLTNRKNNYHIVPQNKDRMEFQFF